MGRQKLLCEKEAPASSVTSSSSSQALSVPKYENLSYVVPTKITGMYVCKNEVCVLYSWYINGT